jgi:hypothetical protein
MNSTRSSSKIKLLKRKRKSRKMSKRLNRPIVLLQALVQVKEEKRIQTVLNPLRAHRACLQ